MTDETPAPDPRLRPPDPAGTQPKHTEDSLLPKRQLSVEQPTLWAPPPQDAADGADEPDIRPRREDEAAAALDDGDVAEPPRYSRYSHRVQFALGALLAIGAAGIVLLVAALIGDSRRSDDTVTIGRSAAWSTWQPASAGVAAAEEIAKHVGQQYHLPNGQQLVNVTGGPLAYGSLPMTVAIQQPADRGGNVELVDGTGVLYRMCDLSSTDKDCAIKYGKPTPSRHQLLRREALELALYSFRYLGVSEVVVILPPGRVVDRKAKDKAKSVDQGAAQRQALLFRRDQGDITAALSRPLDRTLSAKAPDIATVSRWPDARAVQTLTDTKVFSYRLQPGNSEPTAYLVLTPLSVR